MRLGFCAGVIALLASVCVTPIAEAKETLITFELPAGQEQCYYEDVKAGITVELDWDVIAGSDGHEDSLGLQVFDANGRDTGAPARGQNYFEFVTQAGGAVRICFRNRQGFGNNMWVYFDLGVDRANDDDDDFNFLAELHGSDKAAEEKRKELDEKVEAMKMQALHIHQKFTSVIRTQNYLRYREARHRNTAESNHDRVLYWSLFQCAVMIGCAVVQVFSVRRFFDEPAKSGRINF